MGILKVLLLKMLTTKVIGKLVVLGLEALSERTDNTVDDRLTAIVKDALN